MKDMLSPSEKLIPFSSAFEHINSAFWALPEGATIRLGRGRVRNMAFSPDGVYLTVATKIGLWWYELATMQPVALWETERGMVSAISFSHDGKWIATGNDDGITKIFDVQKGVSLAEKERKTSARQLGVSHLAFSPDKQWLAITGIRDAVIDICDPKSGTLCVQLYNDAQETSNSCGNIQPIVFSPDSRLLACLNLDDYISIWDINTVVCIATLTEHIGSVESLSFSPCGNYLASGGGSGTVQVWDANSWKLHQTVPDHGEFSMHVYYSSEGVLNAVGVSDDAVGVWDIKSAEKRYTYAEKQGKLQYARFSGDSQFVVAGAHEWSMWTDDTPQPRRIPYLHRTFPDSVVFSPDGKTLATGSWNDSVNIWDITKPSQLSHFNLPGKDHRVSLSPSGKFWATGIEANTVKVCEIGKTDPEITFSPDGKEIEVSCATFSPVGNLIACGDSNGTLYLWDEQQKKRLHTITAHKGRIGFVDLSPDEKYILSISRNEREPRLWNVESGEPLDTFPEYTDAIAFSPCSRVIACGRHKQILLWDINKCETISILPHDQQSWFPFALAFSHCGQYLASGAWWHRGMGIKKVAIRIWDVATSENIATFRGHPTDVQCLAFSPDNMLLASGSYDNTLLLWNMEPYLQMDK